MSFGVVPMIRNCNKSSARLDPQYIRVENFELESVDLVDAPGSNTPSDSNLWEILDYDDASSHHYKMGEFVSL